MLTENVPSTAAIFHMFGPSQQFCTNTPKPPLSVLVMHAWTLAWGHLLWKNMYVCFTVHGPRGVSAAQIFTHCVVRLFQRWRSRRTSPLVNRTGERILWIRWSRDLLFPAIDSTLTESHKGGSCFRGESANANNGRDFTRIQRWEECEQGQDEAGERLGNSPSTSSFYLLKQFGSGMPSPLHLLAWGSLHTC